ncbi:MAG: four-carbon acid sugar kinase family protein [candidate division FCPU426 bacterium]
MIVASVADDFSGANDLAGRLAEFGFKTWSARGLSFPDEEAEAFVCSVETRLLGPDQARRASRRAWQALGSRFGALVDFQKMDSTLRGNPGEEILGLLEASGAPRVAFCAAYPLHGRITRKGVQYVGDKRLDQSEYFQDPLSPAKTYRPVELFRKGLALTVGSKGLGSALKTRARVLCFDAASEADLARIVRDCLAAGIRHFAGASGLGAELARALSPRPAPRLPRLLEQRIILSGSVSSSAFGQLELLRDSGKAVWAAADEKVEGHPLRLALSTLRKRQDLVRRAGAGEQALKRLVARALRLQKDPTQAYWFLTGGHTAETFFRECQLQGCWVLGNLLPGVPLCRAESSDGKKVWCSTKPGGFGKPDTLVQLMSMG